MSLLARRIKPLFDRVLVRKFAPPKKTQGGLFLPESAQTLEFPQGIVTAVGIGMRDDKGNLLPMTLKVGDEVLLPSYGGQDFKIEDEDFVLLREFEITAILDGDKA